MDDTLYDEAWSPLTVGDVVPESLCFEAYQNEETKQMTGALRLAEFDGFSEIVAKSLLWGQWPVSAIYYKYTVSPDHIFMLENVEPNYKGREYYLEILNKFPWNTLKK